MRIENGSRDGRSKLASGRASFRFVAPGYRFAPGFARFVACPLSTKAAATKVRIEHGRKSVESESDRGGIQGAIEDAMSGLQGTFRTRQTNSGRDIDQTHSRDASGKRMESMMQRSEAAKWFWPFVLVAALAAAIVIAFSPFVQTKAPLGEPEFRMLVTVTAKQPHVADRIPVSIEPSHIVVVANRSPSILDRLVGLLPQRKQT
jgi:hypothetical protein